MFLVAGLPLAEVAFSPLVPFVFVTSLSAVLPLLDERASEAGESVLLCDLQLQFKLLLTGKI